MIPCLKLSGICSSLQMWFRCWQSQLQKNGATELQMLRRDTVSTTSTASHTELAIKNAILFAVWGCEVFICGLMSLSWRRGLESDWDLPGNRKWSAQHSSSVCYDGISCLKEQSCAFNSWFLDLKDLKWIGWFCWMSSSRRWICLRVSLAWDLFMCEVTSLLHFFLSLATRPC